MPSARLTQRLVNQILSARMTHSNLAERKLSPGMAKLMLRLRTYLCEAQSLADRIERIGRTEDV